MESKFVPESDFSKYEKVEFSEEDCRLCCGDCVSAINHPKDKHLIRCKWVSVSGGKKWFDYSYPICEMFCYDV